MSNTNQSIKKQLETLEGKLKLKMLQRANKIMESTVATDFWMTNYVDVLDRYRDGNQINYPVSQPTDRRFGSNFPFWTSESQLSLIRASARILVAMNPSAYGLLNGLTSYVIGQGFRYLVRPKNGSDVDDEIIQKTTEVIENFADQNSWLEMEQEIFSRSREDGEAFLRIFPQPSGNLQVRTIEPEQITQPFGTDFKEWSYGIQTDPDDVFNIKAYGVHYLAPSGESDLTNIQSEIVPSDEIIHIKVNVKRAIKRGLSDFSYDTNEIFNQAGKLRRNLGEGAAVQAAIAAIRQHETSTASQVESFVQQAIDYSTNIPFNGRNQDYQKMDAGSFLDIPKGFTYVPPPGATNATSHLSIFQALLRSAGVRHNAPEWLCSADASNNNYASSLTAESPFLKNCLRMQSFYKRPFMKVITAAIKNAAMAGILPDDIFDLVDVVCTPPTVEARNKAEEASSNQTYVSLGIKSKQTTANELGLDWDTERENIEDYADSMGPALPPLQGELPQGVESRKQEATEEVLKLKKKQVTEAQGRYSDIDFGPPKGVIAAAKRGLELRKKHGRGSGPVGVARARTLSNGQNVTPDTANKMFSYFSRHEVDKKGDGWGEDSAGYIAWLLWGGDPGFAWAKKLNKQMDAADKK